MKDAPAGKAGRGRLMRDAVNRAKQAEETAANTGARLGEQAEGISANLTPFLTSELQHPQGYSQGDTSAMLAAGLGGAGGATSGITGLANKEAATSRNAGGFQSALADAARQRMKAAAGASEGIAATNANLKQTQQQDAARGLQGMYGTDTSGMLGAMGQEANDINAEVNASKTGWLQNANQLMDTVSKGAKIAGGFGVPGFSGFKGGS